MNNINNKTETVKALKNEKEIKKLEEIVSSDLTKLFSLKNDLTKLFSLKEKMLDDVKKIELKKMISTKKRKMFMLEYNISICETKIMLMKNLLK